MTVFEEDFAGIKDAVWIEQLLDGVHHVETSAMFTRHVFGFTDANTMFACSCSTELDSFHYDQSIGFERVLIFGISFVRKPAVDVAPPCLSDHVGEANIHVE